MEEMRSLLDSLMGKDRNETTSKKKYSFKDDDVCKYYLIDFCPHDLFINTKSDIGRCKNIHSDILKEQLENHEDYKYYLAKYQNRFMSTLKKMVETADIKIKKNKERLKSLSENSPKSGKKEKIECINNHICDLLKQAEAAGEKGDLVKATSFNNQVTTLQAEIKRLNEESEEETEIEMNVCEVCGAMKSAVDPVQRVENHVNGKQHMGFEKIRSTLLDLSAKWVERENFIKDYRKKDGDKKDDDKKHDDKKNDDKKKPC
uniref:Luc7-like protein 3 n=1 Tax=Piliocolobus tephrosceles TaxID=591936 RepID=A0A8C9GDW4_9PRIM